MKHPAALEGAILKAVAGEIHRAEQEAADAEEESMSETHSQLAARAMDRVDKSWRDLLETIRAARHKGSEPQDKPGVKSLRAVQKMNV